MIIDGLFCIPLLSVTRQVTYSIKVFTTIRQKFLGKISKNCVTKEGGMLPPPLERLHCCS
jgi:hypothetical protein